MIPELQHVTPQDVAFARAHAVLAAHTTSTVQGEGSRGFGDTAALYRQHERGLVADARAGDLNPALGNDPLAVRALQLRDAYLNATAPSTTLGREGGKLAEATRLDAPAERIAQLEGRIADRQAAQFESSPELAHSRYQQAVEEYAQQHANQGGAPPLRVEYTLPKDEAIGFRPPTGGKGFSDRQQNVKASTRFQAETGHYTTDATAPIRENRVAMQNAVSRGAAQQLFAELGQRHGPNEPIPKGFVSVPVNSANRAEGVLQDLTDHPVATSDFAEQHQMRQRLNEALFEGHQTAGLTRGEGYFVPQGAFDRVQDYMRPQPRSKFSQANAQYQRWLIGTFPSTVLGNTLGTVPLGFFGGAGLRDYHAALSLPGEAFPHTTQGGGAAGQLEAQGTNFATRYNQYMLHLSRRGEDVTHKALFIHGMGGTKGMGKRATALGYDSLESYAKDVALGKVDKGLRDAALNHAIKFVGAGLRPDGKAMSKFGQTILFHKWVEHMAKLMLYTLPVAHPRRLALINALASYGDQYRKDHGVWPSYMNTFYPLFAEKMGLGVATKAVGLGQFSPQNTAGGTIGGLTNTDQPMIQNLLGMAAPWISVPGNTALQQYHDAGSAYPSSLPWVAASQVFRAVPGGTKVFPTAQRGPEFVPLIHPTWQFNSAPPAYPGAKATRLPESLRPGARPLGQDQPFFSAANLGGVASRVFGLPISTVPNAGPVTQIANAKTLTKAMTAAKVPRRG